MDALSTFWSQVIDVWHMEILGVGIDRFVIAFLVFIFFLLVRRLIAHFLVGALKRIVSRTKTNIDDLVLDAVEEPLTLAPLALGIFLSARTLGLDDTGVLAANKMVQTLIAVAIFWGLYNVVNPLAQILQPLERALTPTLIDWVRKALKTFFIFTGAVAVLTIWGIPVMPVLASFSLLSVAIALGAQDFFKNLIGGALIIAERRFNIGDWILVDGVVEGTVERINFRSTTVRRFDKALVNVPNAKLSDSAVTNFSEMTHRRIYWKIGVEYSSSLDQLKAIRNQIEEYILGSDEFAHPPEVSTFVRIDAFKDSSIDIMLYCFTRTTNWGEWLEIKERLAYKIKQIVEDAGSAFAFPSQSVYLEMPEANKSGQETPESFQPPA